MITKRDFFLHGSYICEKSSISTYNFNVCLTILAVRKVSHLNIKTKMFDFEESPLIGWLARVFASLYTFLLRRVYFILSIRDREREKEKQNGTH